MKFAFYRFYRTVRGQVSYNAHCSYNTSVENNNRLVMYLDGGTRGVDKESDVMVCQTRTFRSETVTIAAQELTLDIFIVVMSLSLKHEC